MNRYARRRGWLVVYPGQTRNANPLRCWNWFDQACQAGRGEIAILAAMLDDICERYPVAPERIFVAGLSAGAALAALLAAHHPTRIRAAAVHSGLAPASTAGTAEAYRLMRTGDPELAGLLPSAARDALRMPPLMVIHGDQDNVVIADNGQLLVEAALCGSGRGKRRSGRARMFAATARTRSHTITDYRAWGRLKVRDCRINGLGHAWSGGDDSLPYFDREGPSASALIMRFFEEIAGV
jgi:poly(hydroxyalkanoate) depolymerase family esterase